MLRTRCARLSFCDGAPHRLLLGADTLAIFASRMNAWHDHGHRDLLGLAAGSWSRQAEGTYTCLVRSISAAAVVATKRQLLLCDRGAARRRSWGGTRSTTRESTRRSAGGRARETCSWCARRPSGTRRALRTAACFWTLGGTFCRSQL